MLCLIKHKWTEWVNEPVDKRAHELGLPTDRTEYRFCLRCGASESRNP